MNYSAVVLLITALSSVLPTAVCDKTAYCNSEGEYSLFRVQGHGTAITGLVLVCENGVLSRICDQQWTVLDATVTCRELGYPGVGAEMFTGLNSDYRGDFPSVSSTVPTCTGSEDRLANCTQGSPPNSCDVIPAAVRCLLYAPDIVTTFNTNMVATTSQETTANPHPETYLLRTHIVSPIPSRSPTHLSETLPNESPSYSSVLETPVDVDNCGKIANSQYTIPPLVAGMVGALSTLVVTVVSFVIVIIIVRLKGERCREAFKMKVQTDDRNEVTGDMTVRNQAYSTTIHSIPTAANEAYNVDQECDMNHDYEACF